MALERNRVTGYFEIKEKHTKRNRVTGHFEIKEKMEDTNRDMSKVGFFYQGIIKCN